MLNNFLHILKNMGLRYVLFRSWYEIKKRTGLLQLSFPKKYKKKYTITLDQWRETAKPFFFSSKKELSSFTLSDKDKIKLKKDIALLKSGKLTFFSATTFDLGKEYDWRTNPETNYKYDLIHWAKIPNFDAEKGDIKYVWEKSRFSFLYSLIRYEHHFKESQSQFVFKEIIDWIDKNPLNQGPNYICSQEISLRCMNWIFALYYYQKDINLTAEIFNKIIHSIYGQIKHVENNIQFSRIAVRNNHAITESLFLYLSGMLFPFFKEAKQWKSKGKKYFEQEVLYQVSDDGSFIQYSMNYHRVAVQLFTWAVYLSKKNNEKLNTLVLERIQKASEFLYQCQDEKTGHLPNYGANDGALFFPLNAADFRDYSGQINALHYYFNKTSLYNETNLEEDIFWFTGNKDLSKVNLKRENKSFETGGYFTTRNPNFYSFIRCGNHKNRPSQADNLHLDIWYKGNNILRDGGSYKYNTSEDNINYFFGSPSHNVVTLDNQNQMKKGTRFIWYNWTQLVNWKRPMGKHFHIFEGRIKAFRQIGSIEHKRNVKQHFTEPFWEIEDTIYGGEHICQQIWNISPEFEQLGFNIKSFDIQENEITPIIKEVWYSSFYGKKEPSKQIIFETASRFFRTIISKS